MSSNLNGIQEHEPHKHNISNEKLLFLHNKRTGLAPYTHRFIGEERDPHLVASFVSAMSNFMEEIIGFEQPHWKAEYGSEVTLIVEVGDWVVGCLAVSRETHEVRSKLRRVVREFEESFALLRDATSFDGVVFSEFDRFVFRVFFEGRLTENTRIWRAPDWFETKGRYVLPSIAYRIRNFLQDVEDGMSISSIAKKMQISVEECSNLVALSAWNNVAHLQYVPTKDDILSISSGSISSLLNTNNPLGLSTETILIVSLLDGRQPLIKHLQMLDSRQQKIAMIELGILSTEGYVQRITLEQSLILMAWCIFEKFAGTCMGRVDRQTFGKVFHNILKENILEHPWLGRIKLLDNGGLRLDLDYSMTPSDFDQMYQDIEIITQKLEEASKNWVWFKHNMLSKLGVQAFRKPATLEEIRRQCHLVWHRYISEASL